MNKPIAIYTRVSTDEQGKGYSLPTQLEGCRKFALEKGYTIVGEFQDDFTGTQLSRPEFDKLRELAKSGTIQGIVTYEIDRLSRKMVHQLLIEEEFKKQNVIVEYVLGQYADTPEGQLQKQVRAAIAEYEKEKIKERTLRGLKGRAQAGFVVPGGFSMYGYRYVSSPEGHKGWYEIDPVEAQIVRHMFEWYVRGYQGKQLGIRAIARLLSDMGIPTRFDDIRQHQKMKDTGVWSEFTVNKILKRESYTGTHYYNRTQKINGKQVERPRNEWIPIAIPAIIERSLWEAAQAQAVKNTSPAKHNTKYEYLLKGVLRCAKCGKRCNCDVDTRSKTLQYYRCCGQDSIFSSDLKTKVCSRSIKVQAIDEIAWAYLDDMLRHPENLFQAVEYKHAKSTAGSQALEEELAMVRRKITTTRKEQEKLLDLYLDEHSQMSKEMLSDLHNYVAQRMLCNFCFFRKAMLHCRSISSLLNKKYS